MEMGLIRLAGDRLFPAVVRATAIALLNSYVGEPSERALVAALSDEESLVRWTAARSLGERREVVRRAALLVPLLNDPVMAVRSEAAVGLADVPLNRLKPDQGKAREASYWIPLIMYYSGARTEEVPVAMPCRASGMRLACQACEP